LDYLVISIIIIYLVSIFSVRSFHFYPTHFNRIYPTRFEFIKRKTRFDYSELFAVEIRNRKEPYQRSYVIFHFKEKNMKNKFFSHRSFIYNNVKELIPLLQCLINEKVKVKINMTKEFKDDYDEVIKVIGDYQYKRDE
jgi:regulator of PEP synthase PpsR (kinase-PPPase family)